MEQAANTMTANRFEEMKRFLHFAGNDIENNGADKVRKIRVLLDLLKSRFLSIPREENLSVDEQIIPFKGRSGLKQYNPMKPHKWGYKMWVLCGASGFAYDFELYTGGSDNALRDGEVDCGASGNVVIRLSRSIPDDKNHKLYFDNYFNSPYLQVYIAKRGILSPGTVRPNRIPQSNLLTESELKKKGRGSFDENVALCDGIKVAYVRWYDNKPINLLSTFSGSSPVTDVSQWDKKDREYKSIQCPNLIKIYNKHMGGVDLMDSLIGLYRCKIRSKKWYHRLWFHVIDMVVVNAWLLYKRKSPVVTVERSSPLLSLHQFKSEIAECLCKAGKESRKRGRPSSDEATPPKRAKPASKTPSNDIKFYAIGHWPNGSRQRQRCQRESCKKLSRCLLYKV